MIKLYFNKKPYQEGVAKEIYSYFLRPIIALKPKNVHLKDWLDKIFCVETRTIDRFVATRKFKIPGLYWMAPNKLVPGIGLRLIRKGYEVWVRKDSTMPDRIDVEIFKRGGKKNLIYALTRQEFDKISNHLKLDPLRKNKKVKCSWERD